MSETPVIKSKKTKIAYQFNFQEIFFEAWQVTIGMKRYISIGLLLILILLFAIYGGGYWLLAKKGFFATEASTVTRWTGVFANQVLLPVIAGFLTMPLCAGVFSLILRRVGYEEKTYGYLSIFSQYKKTLKLVGVYLLTTLLIIVGFMLFVVPGVYLTVAYVMAFPLITERDMGVWQAMEVSRKAVSKKWFKHFILLFLSVITVSVTAVITLGIGLVRVLPFWTIAYTVLYRNMFSEVGQIEKIENSNTPIAWALVILLSLGVIWGGYNVFKNNPEWIDVLMESQKTLTGTQEELSNKFAINSEKIENRQDTTKEKQKGSEKSASILQKSQPTKERHVAEGDSKKFIFGDELINNYSLLKKLSPAEENKRAVITPHSSASVAAEHKGIKIYHTNSRQFTNQEIAEIIEFIDAVPLKFMETPPKAIMGATRENFGPRTPVAPFTIALASGPYIFLGDKFFGKSSFIGATNFNERFRVFIHEWTHVIQYYFLETEKGSVSNMDKHSTFVFDFALKVGWHAQKGSYDENRQYSKKKLTSIETPFAPKSGFSWELDDKSGTTDYGGGNPVEDQADSFSFVVAGLPDQVSKQRQAFVLDFLGQTESDFTNGVVPQHEKATRAKNKMKKRFFQEKSLVQEEGIASTYYFIEKEEQEKLQDVAMFYDAEMQRRNFTVVQSPKFEVLKNKEDYFSAVYEYQGKYVSLQGFDYLNAINYSSKGDLVIRVIEGGTALKKGK